MADYPEDTIRAEIAARCHQGISDEDYHALAQQVRAELSAEPPIEPMSDLQVAVRKAGGFLSTDGRREWEAYRLASLTKVPATRRPSPNDLKGQA